MDRLCQQTGESHPQVNIELLELSKFTVVIVIYLVLVH